MPKNYRPKRYGVGYGAGLRSRRTGTLRHAAAELVRIISTGYDPRTLTILPVTPCQYCSRSKDRERVCPECNGFGYIVSVPALTTGPEAYSARNDDAAPLTRLAFMSGPKANGLSRRTWLHKKDGDDSYLVRVYPDGDAVTFSCDCPDGRRQGPATFDPGNQSAATALVVCIHIAEVAKADFNKFRNQTHAK